MIARVFDDKASLSKAAAEQASDAMRRAIDHHGCARIIVATGNSQLDFLDALIHKDIDWQRVEMFHLDEYVGLAANHPASFRKYLQEHLIRKTGITRYHFLEGNGDFKKRVRDVAEALCSAPVDVAFVGIGENGHLAFNDPPSDFETEEPYLLVSLDEACRRQQVGEGWFKSIDEVPPRAITMSVKQIMESAMELVVPLVVDLKAAESWGAMY